MSSRNSHIEGMSVNTEQTGASNDSQLPARQMQTGFYDSREDSMLDEENNVQQTAASTLLQLHERAGIPDISHRETSSNENRSQFGQSRLGGVSGERSFYSRSWTAPYDNRTTASVSDSMNYHSQATVQTTITGLTNAISNLQQEQVTMHSRQENITGTLEQVLSALQDLKDNSRTTLQTQTRTENSSSAQPQMSSSENVTTGPTGNNIVNGTNRPLCEFTSNASSIGGALGANQWASAHDTEQESHAHADDGEAFQIETSTGQEYEVRNYRSADRDTGYSQYYSDNNGRYSNPSVRAEYPRAYSERPQKVTSRYERSDRVGQSYSEYDSYSTKRDRYTREPCLGRRQHSPENYGLKIPPFNGKEDWKVWINRFEAIAERRQWSEGRKLDNLLPKLQGKAGDFVFSQLSKDTLGCYGELVKELNNRFRMVETEKAFAAKFSQRVQKSDETAEEFAAELKRLYAKAYKSRDSKTRQEDLVRKFLDGLKDHEARFEIEFHKEPNDIDEAVYHAVNFIQTRRRSTYERNSERHFKKYTRRTNQEFDRQSDDEETTETEEEDNHAYRIPGKADKHLPGKIHRTGQQTDQTHGKSTEQADSMKVLQETRDLVQALVSQLKGQGANNAGIRFLQENAGFLGGRRKVQCYGCREMGHIIRDCPKRPGKSGDSYGNAKREEGLQQGQQQKSHLN